MWPKKSPKGSVFLEYNNYICKLNSVNLRKNQQNTYNTKHS